MFEKIKQSNGNTFYNVEVMEIENVQKALNIILPRSLRIFYQEVGYGFLHSKEDNINRIMDPSSVCEFRTQKGQFAGSSQAEDFKIYEEDKLVFFEVSEVVYISIGFTGSNGEKIFYRNKKIADSIEEFLEQYMKDENYFL